MTDTELVRVDLADPLASSTLRHLARSAARGLGLSDVDTARVTTAASELVRVAEGRTGAAVLAVSPEDGDRRRSTLDLRLSFPGAEGAVRAENGLQRSLNRLMDAVLLDGDTVAVRKTLASVPTRAQLVTIRDELLSTTAADDKALMQGVQEQLVSTLSALRQREGELVALNAELDQTNRGVVALYADLERKSNLARTAQRRVFEQLEAALRPPPPTIAFAQTGVRYLPAEENSPTGGDLYDWFELQDGTLFITVVDVRGHGVESTRDALQVTHTVRTLALEGHPLEELLARADTILRARTDRVVATAAVLRFDPGKGEVQVASGGHPPVLVVAADGRAEYLVSTGRPIGYDGAGSRDVATRQLAAGDTVLVYTDGLVEIRRDILEGMETLREVAGGAAAVALPRLLDQTLTRCLRDDIPFDDILLLAVRWTPTADA